MSFLSSQPDDAMLMDVFRAHPETARPLLEYHVALLRGPSPLTVGQRELIAAYVSGLNSCNYCHGIHGRVAEAFDVPEATLAALIDDLDTAEITEPMRCLLGYVRTLTLTPDRVRPSAAEAVLAAGWSEQALHDAVAVCALFNFMNRYVNGLGITTTPERAARSADRLAGIGYAGLLEMLDE